MENFWQTHRTSMIALAVAAVALFSTVIVVPETQQAVIVRGGDPVSVVNRFEPDQRYGNTGAGIWWRIPFIDRVDYIDKRVLALNMEPQTVLSTDQLRLNVDAYARYRIIDPVRMVRTAGTPTTVESQLSQIFSSVVRQELGRRSFASLLTAERGTTMANITRKLDTQARKYGAQVIDVRIKQADLPDGSPLELGVPADADRAPAGSRDPARAGPEERPDHPCRGRGAGRQDLCRGLWQGSGVLRFLPRDAELPDDFRRRFQVGEHDHPVSRQRVSQAVPREPLTVRRCVQSRLSPEGRKSAARANRGQRRMKRTTKPCDIPTD